MCACVCVCGGWVWCVYIQYVCAVYVCVCVLGVGGSLSSWKLWSLKNRISQSGEGGSFSGGLQSGRHHRKPGRS